MLGARKADIVVNVLGIDPGLENVGVARLEFTSDGDVLCRDARVIVTKKPSKKKAMTPLRQGAEDVTRTRQIWKEISEFVSGCIIDAVAYEAFSPIPGRSKNATKTSFAVGVAVSIGFALGVPVYAVTPVDVKIKTTGQKSASKGQVIEAVCQRIPSIREWLDLIPKTKRDHAADAAGVALIGYDVLRGY